MYYIGKIDKEIYRCITDQFTSSEVIITQERIDHIHTRHSEDYMEVLNAIAPALETPDYILQDTHDNTGIILKTIGDLHIQVILKINISEDETKYKNSIISCWKISNKRMQNYIRNKHILYERVLSK